MIISIKWPLKWTKVTHSKDYVLSFFPSCPHQSVAHFKEAVLKKSSDWNLNGVQKAWTPLFTSWVPLSKSLENSELRLLELQGSHFLSIKWKGGRDSRDHSFPPHILLRLYAFQISDFGVDLKQRLTSPRKLARANRLFWGVNRKAGTLKTLLLIFCKRS